VHNEVITSVFDAEPLVRWRGPLHAEFQKQGMRRRSACIICLLLLLSLFAELFSSGFLAGGARRAGRCV